MINTLIAIIKEIDQSSDGYILGLNRLGSNGIENYIGRIRSLCHENNRFDTILHNLARYELIVRDFDQRYLVFKPRYSNQGGCVLNQTGREFEFDCDPQTISNWLFEEIGIDEKTEKNGFRIFLEELETFSEENPYPKANLSVASRNQN